MQRVKLGLVCLPWLLLAGAVSAQTELGPESSTGVATVQNYSGGGVLDGTYFDLRHVVGDGVGWTNSYSQLGLFTPIWLNEDAFIAPNERLIVTNSTQTGINLGLVGRQYVNSWDRILGLYSYYDNDQDARNFRYSQFNVGAETLGRWWDARMNGYILTGTTNNFIGNVDLLTGNPFFFLNNIGFVGHTNRDQALGGGDAEIGTPLSPGNPWLRGYAGAYVYHTGGNGNATGFRGRLEATVSNDLTLGVMVTQDPIYGTNVNGTIDFKFSGFNPTRYFPNLTTRQRMLNPVQRNWRIATRTYVQNVDVAAINPATGKPYFIVHVDNSAPPGGNGTIEHPFNFLRNGADPATTDIILVHRGLATTAATAVTGSVVLSNNERLLGDGILSTLPLAARFGTSSIVGTFNLPGTSNSHIFPYVTNADPALNGGNIVTLMNNNEVAGLNLVNSVGSAITNTAAGSQNFQLHDLEITGNAGKGIALSGASGVGIISRINQGAVDHVNPLGIGNNTGGGIQITTAAPGLFLQMSNVNMNATPPGAQAFGISLAANAGSLNANFNNVNTNGNGVGIQLSETSQQLLANLNTVRSNGNTGAGISIKGTGGSITVNGDNVGAMGNGGDNLDIGTAAAPIITSTVGVSFVNSNFSNSVTGSGIVFSQSGGFGTLNLLSATLAGQGANVSGNAVDGLAIYATNSTLMNANVRNGVFTGNGRDAFHVDAATGSTVNLFVDPTDASRNGRNGLFFTLAGDAVFNTTFLNDNLNNNGNSAVSGILTNFSVVNLFFDNTTGANSGGNGFNLDASANSLANLEIDHGTFANSGQLIGGSSGINIKSDNSRVNLLTDMTVANNITPGGTIGNQAYGLTLDLQNSSVFRGTIQNGDFSDTLVDGINASVASSSNATLTLLNTIDERSGFDGFVAKVDHAQMTINSTNSNVLSSGRHGLNFNVTNAGTLTGNFDNSNFGNNAGSGLFGIVSGTNSTATLSLINNSFVNFNSESGLAFNVNGGALNVEAFSSSFSSNGLGGVVGSGVLGTVLNDGVFRFNFINTAVDNNLDNGIFVTAQNASSIQGSFSLGSVANNGIGTLSPHHNDGIRLEMDDSGFSTLTVFNNAQILGNGNDGIAILATNFTNFTGVFDTINIQNNGAASAALSGTRAGFDVTTQSNSQVNLSFDGVTIGNSSPFGTQFEGLLSTTTTGGLMTASLTSTNLSNNLINALNANVLTNSEADFTLRNVQGDNSGNTAALFNVSGGSRLNVDAALNTSFSAAGGSGILVQVDGTNSVANIGLDSVNLTANGFIFGGHGFSGLVTNGGTLNACLDTSALTNNSNEGIQLVAANANSTINFNVNGSSVDFNSGGGLSINVIDQATVNYRSINTTYDSNGANGSLDGVTVSVIGNGPSDSATARLLFAGGSMDNNTGNGISLDAENGATMTTSIDTISASDNQGLGMQISASGTNTKFNLLMNGNSTFANNTLGSISPFTFSNMDQVVLAISGSFDNSLGDGLHFDLQNINNAVVAVSGGGTINDSALNGININMQNITNGSVLIDGVGAINRSGNDGIRINFDTVAQGGISIIGPTSINGSGADAIDITVNNTALVDNMTFGLANVQVLTLNDNLVTGNFLNGCLPAPVTFALDATGLTSTQALLIEGVTAQISADTGFNILTTASSIDTLAVVSNFVATANGTTAGTGDTIHFDLTGTPVTTLDVISNQIGGAKHNGVNFDLNASPITTVNIAGNSIGAIAGANSAVDDSLPIIVPGFTANSLAANDDGSTATAIALGFTANYFGTPYTSAWVNNNGNITFDAPLAAFTPFNLLSTARSIIAPFFADVDTRSGNTLTYGTSTINGHNAFGVDWIDVRHFSASGGGNNGLPTNTFQLVMVDRSDIAPGDFDFEFNYQKIVWEAGTASGSDSQGLGGNSARAGWSNGSTASLELPGSAVNGALLDNGPAATALIHNSLNSVNDGRYIFFVRNGQVGGVSPSGDDGIRFNATNGSNVANFNVNSNLIENAGKHGIEMLISGSDVNNQVYTNNNIHDNVGDGIRMVDPATNSGTINAVFHGNTVSSNGLSGINLNLRSGAQNLTASFSSNDISNNAGNAAKTAGGIGVDIVLADNRNFTGGFDSNTINGNGIDGGVIFDMGLNGRVTSDFTNNTILNNEFGIDFRLKAGGHYEGANFYGNAISTSVDDDLAVRLTVPDQASFNWNIGDVNHARNNFTAGVAIDMTGSATGNLHVANSTFSNGVTDNDGDETPGYDGGGLHVALANTAVLNNAVIGTFNAVNSIATNDVTFSNNSGSGFSIFATDNSAVSNLLITNVNALSNTADGISFFRQGQPTFTNITIQNSQLNSNANGLHIVATNAQQTDDYTINNNQILTNTANGVLIDARFDAQIIANMNGNTISGNTGDGIHLIEQKNTDTDNRLISGLWTLNTITNNTGNGININANAQITIGASTTQPDNVITGNTLNGILIQGVGTSGPAILTPTTTIQGNIIDNNGQSGVAVSQTASDQSNIVTIDTNEIQSNGTNGVQMLARGGANLAASIDNSSIRFNGNDGIQLNSSGQVGTGNIASVTIGTNNPNGNDISDNLGHGINILNQNNGNASYDIQNNAILRNGLEGVYAVNSASATQTQNSTVNVVADGNVFDNAQMRFVVNNNAIIDNGHLATGANFSDTTGLFLRVGTNGSSQSTVDPGGFASTASAVTSVSGASLTGRGGVLALVTNNIFGGNAGHDVAFESFVSTVPPTLTTGTWTDQNDNPPNPANDVFQVTSYQTDPLARLDMRFTGNVGEDANVARSGAFFNTDEPVFKSRINNDPANVSPPGPFTSETRDRNAQRLASRAPPFNAPTTSPPSPFLYPGVGNSTFRVSTDSDFNNGANANTNTFAANDTFFSTVPLGVLFGELPFNWQTNLAP